MAESKRVAVVGAGVGGLSTAIRLQRTGFDVTVFEKNPTPGGRMNRLVTDEGYTFDTGPSLLLMTDTYRELFSFAGRNLDDYVNLVPITSSYRVNFGDGDALNTHRTLPELISELERIEPGVTPNFYRFLADACLKYRLGRSEFVERDFDTAQSFFGLRNLGLLRRTSALGNYYRSVSKFFATDKLRQAFSLQTMYLGLSPFEAPAVYSLLPYTELAEDGLWFPEGGMYEYVLAMEKLARELGVKLNYNSSVQKIARSEGKATGLIVNGEEQDFDATVVNADLPYAYRELLDGEHDSDLTGGLRQRKREDYQYTASAFMLYLGLDVKLDQMVHHNFYLSSRYRENFEAIFRDGLLPEDPSFYAVVPSKTASEAAPEGGECLFVLIPVPHLGPGVDWEKDGEEFKQKVYGMLEERCGIANIRDHIVHETVKTPEDWRDDYNLEEGAAFGLGHGIFQVGYFRPEIKSRSIENLYFVGASTRPGTGVPLVTIGARTLANRMLREIG